MTGSFGARLHAVVDERGPLCVGIDPHPALLDAWGLGDDVAGLERMALTVVEALADRVAVLKPQSAFFERFGSRGIAVLERVLADVRAAGAIALLDVKRGDIGSTVQAYAQAYCDPRSTLFADAVTASPFLGVGSLDPLVTTAVANGAGVFVLARTSNPEGGEVQLAVSGGRTVAASVVEAVGRYNLGLAPLGSVGVVVGATLDRLDVDLSQLNGPVLVPGMGAQGGTGARLRELFGDVAGLVLPSTSRDVLVAGPTVKGLRSAAAAALEDSTAALHRA